MQGIPFLFKYYSTNLFLSLTSVPIYLHGYMATNKNSGEIIVWHYL